MGQGKKYQHPGVIRRPENFLKFQVGARFATVVVGVDRVDAQDLEALKSLPGRGIIGRRGAELVADVGRRRYENPAAVEVKIPPLDPKFPEAEGLGQGPIQDGTA